jgi:hypothetical protein
MKRRANPEAQHSRQYAIAESVVICLAGLIASACLFALTALAEEGPPTALAIIACSVDEKPRDAGSAARDWRNLEWRMPVQCMRVVETLSDATALNNPGVPELHPDMSLSGTCAALAMAYAPTWEAAHKNWAVVKIGSPTRMVDADGRTVGWHMPECQGTLPGTNYPLRCAFDPSEI